MLPKLQRGFVILVLVTAALLVSGPSSRAQTPPPPQPTDPPRKQSTVSGRVIYEDTRRPLRRVQLTIWDPAGKTRTRSYEAWTDGRGEFQIANIPAGKYFIDVIAPGIIHTGPYDAEENLTSFTVDGTSNTEVVVRVRRGGAISGRVTYADGDPAINACLRIFHKKNGKWDLVIAGDFASNRAITDDRGMYRVSGLWPGEYRVGAAEQKWGIEINAQDQPDGSRILNRAVLGTSYYDGATTMTSATVLTIQAGDEQKDINITLADRAAHRISGTVAFRGNTRAVDRARVSLKRKDETLPGASDLEEPVTNTDENGHFIFDEVEDGT